jgi:hypothetical protein
MTATVYHAEALFADRATEVAEVELGEPVADPVGPIDTSALVDVEGGVPLDVWIIAGTPVSAPYPCRCDETSPWRTKQCGTKYCPCDGRIDVGPHLPSDCCAMEGA